MFSGDINNTNSSGNITTDRIVLYLLESNRQSYDYQITDKYY